MSVSPTSKTLNIGETVQLTGTKNPTSASEGTQWTSSNTGVATVSGSGLVTAKAAGTATITFKNSSSTKSASCTITVAPAEGIVYTAAETTAGVMCAGGQYWQKINSKGNSVWSKTDYDYYPYEVTTLENGNIVVACTSLASYRDDDDDADNYVNGGVIYVVDQKGNTILNLGQNHNYGYRYVTSSKDGGFFVGNWYSPRTSYYTSSINVYKYTSSGKIEWTYNITKNGVGTATNISRTQDNGIIFYYGGYIYKLNKNGALEWKVKGSSNIAALPNGKIATIGGYTLKILNSSGSELVSSKLSESNSPSWNYYSSAYNYIAASSDNYIYLASSSGKVAKYDTNGTKIWEKSIYDADKYMRYGAGNLSAIATFSDGGVVVGTKSSMYLVKYDKNGNVVWAIQKGWNTHIQDITIVKE